MVNTHNSLVLRMVNYLLRRGLQGRADHIGNHRFQKKAMGLFVGRFRPDILLNEGSSSIVIEVIGKEPMRGGRLVEALSFYKGSGITCIVLAPHEALEALRDAFGILNLEPDLLTSNINHCAEFVIKRVKQEAKSVQSTPF